MKKLSSSFLDAFFGSLQQNGISGVSRFGLQGQVLYPSVFVSNRPSASQLRFALQESIELGGVYLHHVSEGTQWVFALVYRQVVQGGLCGRVDGHILADRIREEGESAYQLFYASSGWIPTLLQERRQGLLRREQMATAKLQRSHEMGWGHTFEQEHKLLACIRAGDRNGARRLLNEMLAGIYMSDPHPSLLRARVIELMGGLTRAAIEDNPLLESLIIQNHQWTERMVHADSFESLSTILMEALDAFIDAVHLHGSNRTNEHVHKALTYIAAHFQESLRLEKIAQQSGISMYRLAHLFREHTGKTVVETIRELRLERATLLLLQTKMTCAEVAYAVGFTDQSYFIHHFKRYTGITPKQYRMQRGHG